MNLAKALSVLATSDMGAANPCEALRLVGVHLAARTELPAGTNALIIDAAAHNLYGGACEVYGDLPRFVATTGPSGNHYSPVTVSWLTGRPPADKPLAVVAPLVTTGLGLLAVLEDLHRPGPAPVLVFIAMSNGLAIARASDYFDQIVSPTLRGHADEPDHHRAPG